MRTVLPAFKRVLDQFDSYSQFADAIGQSRQTVNYWLRNRYIPAEYAVEASLATGGKITPLELINEARREGQRRKILRRAAKAAKDAAAVSRQAEGGEA